MGRVLFWVGGKSEARRRRGTAQRLERVVIIAPFALAEFTVNDQFAVDLHIVDLGLVYSMSVEPTEKNKNLYKVTVQMTLTAPGCGMGPAIAEDAKSKVMLVPGVDSAEVNLTWEPAWDQSMISEEGRMILGLI